MILVFLTSCGQNQTEGKKNIINSETTGIITSYGPNTSVRSIKQDRKGNIWLASNEGIIRYDGKTFTNITDIVGSDRFFSVLEDRKGNFWFGNNGSGVYRYDGKTITDFKSKGGQK
jgi:ligand-binding sensor domain-containing protein